MKNDYLWDGSGEADPEVERLERLLGRLRAPAPPPLELRDARRSPLRWMIPLLATAAAVVLMVTAVWRATRTLETSWEVASLAGHPRIGAATLAETGRLSVGDTLATDASSR